MAIQRQCNDQPHHLLRRQTSPADTRHTARLNRVLDPLVRQMLTQPVQIDRLLQLGKTGEVIGQHGDAS
jgi:hypothetical protein